MPAKKNKGNHHLLCNPCIQSEDHLLSLRCMYKVKPCYLELSWTERENFDMSNVKYMRFIKKQWLGPLTPLDIPLIFEISVFEILKLICTP